MDFSKKGLKPGAYEIVEEGRQQVLKLNYLGVSFPSSVAYSKLCMGDVVEKLIQVPSVNRIILSSDRNYLYDEGQTQMIREIANLYIFLTKQKRFLSSLPGVSIDYLTKYPAKLASIQYVITNLLKSDPIGSYVELKRMIREQKIRIKKIKDPFLLKEENNYLKAIIEIFNLIERLKLISIFLHF